MAQAITIPTHTLTAPLSSDDEQILRQAWANHHQIQAIIDRAKAIGMDVSQHAARAEQHLAFITRALEQFFPTPMTPPPEATADVDG